MHKSFFSIVVLALLPPAVPQQYLAPPAKPLAQRIADRSFPSVFQAWNPAENLKEDPEATVARHDLYWNIPEGFGLRWDGMYPGAATSFRPDSVAGARALRERLLARNPNMVLLASVYYFDAPPAGYLPPDHPWWRRDGKGNRVAGWQEGGNFQLNWDNPAFRAQVIAQARAAVESGVVDGIMLDQWHGEDSGRLTLLKGVREAIRPDRLIIVNHGPSHVPKSAPYVNGQFLENCFQHRPRAACLGPVTPAEWRFLAGSLLWAEKHLRSPRVNALETWFVNSRTDVNRMRAATTLALTHSDGYTLFADPNGLPAPDHLHDWYPFWDFKSLGKPREPMIKRRDGAFQREFTGGTVVYNPLGNKIVTVTFDRPRTSAATGKSSTTFTVEGMDGDLYLM
ncbi:MAG TPA: putative glycoside hydrolase [Bryobacteraceae bacterium]|jgi:hypothetical protein